MNRSRTALAGAALVTSAAIGAGITTAATTSTRDTVAKVRTDLRALQQRYDAEHGPAPTTPAPVPTTRPGTPTPTPTTGPPTTGVPSTRPRVTVPASIPTDCSRNVQADLTAFFITVARGSDVVFPENGCYATSARIELRHLSDLRIDGNGSLFKSSHPNDNDSNDPVFYLFRVDNVELHDARLTGNFEDIDPATGKPGTPNINRGSIASSAGVSVYGGANVSLHDLTIRNVFGDGVLVSNSWVEDVTGVSENPTNVRVERVTVDRAARICLAITAGTGIWFVNNQVTNCYYNGIHLEVDVIERETVGDIHWIGNTVGEVFTIPIVVATGQPRERPATGLEIRGNKVTHLAHAAVCNQPIVVGPHGANYWADVVVDGNELLAWRNAVELVNVLSGSVTDNRITYDQRAKPNDCGPRHESPVVLTNSPNVTVRNNG